MPQPEPWLLPELPIDIRAWRLRLGHRAQPGSGARANRHTAGQHPCCVEAIPERLSDGRSMCLACECFWSASHSGTVVTVARSRASIGVDIQLPVYRPHAFRMWGERCGVPDAGLSQWVLGEACLKAAGIAFRLPEPGVLRLPRRPATEGGLSVVGSVPVAWRWGDATNDLDGCYWALAWTIGEPAPAAL